MGRRGHDIGVLMTLIFVLSLYYTECQPTLGKTARSTRISGRSTSRLPSSTARSTPLRPGRKQSKDLDTCIAQCEKKKLGICKTPEEITYKAEEVAEEHHYLLNYASLREVQYYRESWQPYTCYCSVPGVKGLSCNEKCPQGQYGPMCWAPCSQHCKNPLRCNARNGACSGGCKEGYQEPNCIHKKKCETKSPTCVYGYCYSDRKDKIGEVTTTQECICGYGVNGLYCDKECVRSYGYMCRIPCGKCTANDCDRYTGACLEPLLPWKPLCNDGYEPPNCYKKKSTEVDTNLIVMNTVVEYFTKLEQNEETLVAMEKLWNTLNDRDPSSIKDAVTLLGPDLEIYMNVFHEYTETSFITYPSTERRSDAEAATAPDNVPMFRAGDRPPDVAPQNSEGISVEEQQVARLQLMVREWEEEMEAPVRSSVRRAVSKPTEVSIAGVKIKSRGSSSVRRRQTANAMEVEYEVQLPPALAANQNLEETVARAVQSSAVNVKSRIIPGLEMDKDSVRVANVHTPHAASQSTASEAIVVFGIAVVVCIVLLATTVMCFISYKNKQRTSNSTSRRLSEERQRYAPQTSRTSTQKNIKGHHQ